MESIDKVVRLGTGQTGGGRHFSVYAHIRYDGAQLSISGVEGPTASGNALGSCGQIVMERPSVKPAPGWTPALVSAFYDVWEAFHLNGMRAACSHQRALGWTYGTHAGQTCFICGYAIGSAWLHETVPEWALDFLAALPDTDITPAWV